jgi:hypothetical protein
VLLLQAHGEGRLVAQRVADLQREEHPGELGHLLRAERAGVAVGQDFRHAGEGARGHDALALQRPAHVEEGARQVGQRPVQVGRPGLLHEPLDLGRHDGGDGVADEAADERPRLPDVFGQRQARAQGVRRPVEAALGDLDAGAQRQQAGRLPHRLDLRQQGVDAAPAQPLRQAPVAGLAAGALVDQAQRLLVAGEQPPHFLAGQPVGRQLLPLLDLLGVVRRQLQQRHGLLVVLGGVAGRLPQQLGKEPVAQHRGRGRQRVQGQADRFAGGLGGGRCDGQQGQAAGGEGAGHGRSPSGWDEVSASASVRTSGCCREPASPRRAAGRAAWPGRR